MPFTVTFTPSADEDLAFFKPYEQRVIVTGIRVHLTHDAADATKRKKQLKTNTLAPWELRIDIYRVFYSVDMGATVKVIAIGYKEHNNLYIQGKKVEL